MGAVERGFHLCLQETGEPAEEAEGAEPEGRRLSAMKTAGEEGGAGGGDGGEEEEAGELPLCWEEEGEAGLPEFLVWLEEEEEELRRGLWRGEEVGELLGLLWMGEEEVGELCCGGVEEVEGHRHEMEVEGGL